MKQWLGRCRAHVPLYMLAHTSSLPSRVPALLVVVVVVVLLLLLLLSIASPHTHLNSITNATRCVSPCRVAQSEPFC